MKEIIRDKNPVEIFELSFTEELLLEIYKQFVLYATQKNKHNFILSTNCLRNFIAFCFLVVTIGFQVKDNTGL